VTVANEVAIAKLIKAHNNRKIVFLHLFRRHLLFIYNATTSCGPLCRGGRSRLLCCGGARCVCRCCLSDLRVLTHLRIHFSLYGCRIEAEIIQNSLLKSPAEEVQLSNSCEKGRLTGNLEVDSFTTAEGIKEFLAVRLQLTLVIRVDEKLLPLENIRCVVCLGVVGDEPVNETEGESGRAEENRENLSNIRTLRIEALKTLYNEFLLAMDLSTASLRIRIKPNHVFLVGVQDLSHLL